MSELENLASKSDADLIQIAVAFGDFTPEQAQSKTREELISAISGNTDAADRSALSTAEVPAPKKRGRKPKTVKPAEEKTAEEVIALSADKANDGDSDSSAAAPEVKIPKKRGRKPKVKADSEEKPKDLLIPDWTVDNTPSEEAKASADETYGIKKTSDAKEHKSSPSEQKYSKTERTAKSGNGAVHRRHISDKNIASGEVSQGAVTVSSDMGNGTDSVSDEQLAIRKESHASQESKTPDAMHNADRRGLRTRKRKLSFGPGQDVRPVEDEEPEQIPDTDIASEIVSDAEEVAAPAPVEIPIEGVLSIGNPDSNKNDFCGFIHRSNYLPGDDDAYVPGQIIKRMGLRRGDFIKGVTMPKRGKEKYAPLKRIVEVNGIIAIEDNNYENIRRRPKFENLTAIYPDERLTLETAREDISSRIIDLFSPIGKGQRGMIVSPPKAGKTILLQKVANSITTNNPGCELIVLLIDERPEEVTDMQRNIKGEVVYSTFDKRPENHVRVTELVLERAMRLVELGKDVVILLDSMTRLARAYNLTINPTGRTLSGGLDPGSLYGPKRFFGAARNIEHGGSLTILATALVETGSRMDEVIFEEFKGTGNMEVTLDRKLADRRVFPAIAVDRSGTRREELLLTPEELDAVWLIRRRIAEADTITATNAVINFMTKTPNNRSFILSVKKSFATD